MEDMAAAALQIWYSNNNVAWVTANACIHIGRDNRVGHLLTSVYNNYLDREKLSLQIYRGV